MESPRTAVMAAASFMNCRLPPPRVEPWTETFLHKFDSNGDDGCNPSGHLIFDKAGDLFGVTFNGGGASGIFETLCSNGCGTAYKLHLANGAWTQTILHHFTGEGTPDGVSPTGGLAFDKAGNLWGTTVFGGAGDSSTCGDPNGGLGLCGTVFELTPNANGTVWTESTLYSFVDASTGWNPFSGVILDAAGNLVGTTENGGIALQGTVFEDNPLKVAGKSTESLIHQFDGEADGAFPANGLTLGAEGSLYGVVSQGGGIGGVNVCTEDSDESCGIVYKLTPGSDGTWTETILYTFKGGADGAGAFRTTCLPSAPTATSLARQGRRRLRLQQNRLCRFQRPPRRMRCCVRVETVTASGA